MSKNNTSIQEMLELSEALYDNNKERWMKKSPESNIYWIGWLITEIGEVLDIIKKKGADKIMNGGKTRQEMIEELVDCYMYLADILNRYNIVASEFSRIYHKKMEHNLKRDYNESKTKKDKFMESLSKECQATSPD